MVGSTHGHLRSKFRKSCDCNSKKADRTPTQAHMKLRKEPVRPAWKPIYADRMNRVKSWSKFISEAYWIVELED